MCRSWTISLLAAALVSGGQAAHAQPLCGEIPDVMVVLDRSGSMKEIVDGQTKAAIAKSAVQHLVAQFGGQLALGLTLFPRWPHVNDCSTAVVNVSPSTSSGASIGALLNSNFPKGNTPIAASLEAAGAHLQTKGGPRYVILVTDGKETCLSGAAPLAQPGTCAWNQGTTYRKCGGCGWQFCLNNGTWSGDCAGNPDMFGCTYGQTCQANGACNGTTAAADAVASAQKLAAWGIKTYVIGFGSQVDASALSAVASAGGTGQYYQATSLGQLESALSQIGGAISCCGNGALDAGELCDTKIAAGLPGACPTSCADANPCTLDALAGSACQARCEHSPITAPKSGDGCCPAGATSATDSDCGPTCGNGVLDAGERCDTKIPANQFGGCPTSCDDQNACTRDQLVGVGCDARCEHQVVTAPQSGDGCCPPGATDGTDSDCPAAALCGNGRVDAGERCDTAVASGLPGACPGSCNDQNACTADTLHGAGCTAFCASTPITTAQQGDGCCPPGASSATDSDCASQCGNGVLDAGEQCDPAIVPGAPGSCAMNCDDQDACTRDVVVGSGCAAQCANVPVAPSTVQQDGCCPAGSVQGQDADCLPACTPDRTEGCIDPCVQVTCPDGQYCVMGGCQDWPAGGAPGVPLFDEVSGGCDCRTGSGPAGTGASAGLAVALLALLSFVRRRR